MTPAPARAASEPTTGQRLTREIIRAQQAAAAKDVMPTMDVWAGEGATSFTSSQPMVMGSAKAASQTYNAGALFTNTASALSKG